jgi:hypothetical protein
VSESSALELKLDIDELQELHTMCTQLANKNYIEQLIAHLTTMRNKIPYCTNNNGKEERKWSDIVAGRSLQASKPNTAATHNIETVITSRSSDPSKETYGMELNSIISSSTVRKEKKNYQDQRPKIVALGDSHARGIAGELMHQSNHHLNTIGYVKPNARLEDLLNTAKSEISKLIKTDTIIMFGGSNDIDKNTYSKNLTSIRNFLEDTQNTNVIL